VTLRVVLDTDIVLSAMLFKAGRLAWIRRAWQHQQLHPLVCRDTANELLRVLAYPKFELTAQEKKDLLGDFLPYTEVITLPTPWPDLPACRDEKDQVFLFLRMQARPMQWSPAMRTSLPCEAYFLDGY